MSRDPIRLVRSAGAATVAGLWRMGITFATYFVLRRLISPAEMGVWNWAEPLFLLLAQIRDLGVPGHVVRQRQRDYGGYLLLQVLWGGALAAVLALAAPLLALAFEDRDANIVPILRTLCLFLWVQGLGSVPLTYFEAEQHIQGTIPAELVRNTLFAALSLLLAFRGYGVWSIVVAYTLAGGLYSAVLWWWARRRRPGGDRLDLGRTPETLLVLVQASWPLALMSLLENAVLNLDPLLLAMVGDEAVAHASLTLYSLFFFSRLIADQVGRALYPALVAAHQRPHRSFELYRIATLLLTAFVVPTSFVFFFNARAVALVLGGEQWVSSGRYLTVAAFVPFLRPLSMFGREYLLVLHRDRLVNLYSLLNLVSLGSIGYALVHTELGELGMAVAGYFPLGMLLLGWGLRRIDPRAFDTLIRQLLENYLVGALLFAPVLLLPDASTWVRLGVSVALAAVCAAWSLWRHRRAYLAFWHDTEAGDAGGEDMVGG